MSEPVESRLSKSAVAAFVLGVSSLILSIGTALPALYVGIQAVRAINSSDGRLRGLRLAVAGLIAASAVTLLSIVGSVALALLYLQDKSQLAGCTNNFRQIGLAVNAYHDQKWGHFPSATVSNTALTPEQRLSWEAAILPYLASGAPAGKKWQTLAGDIDYREGWQAPVNDKPRKTNVSPYLCPTFVRGFSTGAPGLTSYAGVAGVGLDAATLPLKNPRAGFFGYDRLLARSDITAGISTTMMVLETARDNGPWLASGEATVRGLDPNSDHLIGLGQPFGGLHREGVNVLWADSSVRLLNDRIDPDSFRAQARIVREVGE